MSTTTFATVKDVLVQTLGLEDRADSITESTALFGSLPELDSLAIVELITVIEDRFGLEMDDADITGKTFETVASLTAYVEGRRS